MTTPAMSSSSTVSTLMKPSLRQPGRILLVSCYEVGHQPVALARVSAFLRREGYKPSSVDLAARSVLDSEIVEAAVVGISVPMHTALRLGVEFAKRVRLVNSKAQLLFFGHYALLHREYLEREFRAVSFGGEFEAHMVRWVAELKDPGELNNAKQGVSSNEPLPAQFAKLDFPQLPGEVLGSPSGYAQLETDDGLFHVGAIETSRGCKYKCRHCPVPAVYGGRFFIVPQAVVMNDIRQQVSMGAQHVSFIDADFLNGPGHALSIVREMHEEFPQVTCDFVARVDHIIKFRKWMPEFARCGTLFIVSALECMNDETLRILDKGHTVADVHTALKILDRSKINMRPSWMPFTPWSTMRDFAALLDFIEEQDLVEHVDPVQYSIRLLVPKGSLLLDQAEMQEHLGHWDPEALAFPWIHPNPNMDQLQNQVAILAQEAATKSTPARETFAKIRQLSGSPHRRPLHRRRRPPHLTESWFC